MKPQIDLRDWLAGALDISGYILKDPDQAAAALGIEPPRDDTLKSVVEFSFRAQATIRYAYADAMIKERLKEPSEIATLLNELDIRVSDLVMLKKAVVSDDPKSELLVRIEDMLRETRAVLAQVGGKLS